MQKVIIALIIIVMILAGVLVATPFIIDKESLKANVISKINDKTGLEFKSDGEARIWFFPRPYIQLSEIYIENSKKSSSSNFFSASQLKIFLNIAPLLKFDFETEHVQIQSPSLELEKLEDGKSNWSLIFNKTKSKLTNNNIDSQIVKLSIENGTINHTRGLSKKSIKYLDTDIQYDTESKILSTKGNFSNNQRKITFNSILSNDPNTVSNIKLQTNSSMFSFTGKFSEQSKAIVGKLDGNIKKIDEFAKVMFDESSKFHSISSTETLEVVGDLSISPNIFRFSDINLKSESINGDVDVSYGLNLFADKNSLWDISVDLVNLDLDKLFSDSVKEDNGIIDYYSYNSNYLKLSDFNFSLPNKIDIKTDIKFNKVQFLQREIKDVSLSTSLTSGKADISELSMVFPGSSKLQLKAQISNNGIRPFLQGKLDVYGNKLRDLVIWLNPKLSFIPEGVMNNYAFSSSLSVTPLKFKLDDISLIFDKSIVNGGIFINPHKNIPQLNANITVDRLNLDSYNITSKYLSNKAEVIDKIGTIFDQKSWLRKVSSNYNIVVESKNVIANNNIIDSVKLSSTISPSRLKVRALDLNSQNSDVKIKSEVSFLENIPKFTFELNSKKLNLNDFVVETGADEEKTPNNFAENLKKIQVKTYGIEKFTGEVDINIDELKTKNLDIKNAKLSSTLKGSRIQKKVTFEVFDGVAGFYGLSFISPNRISLQGKYVLKQVDLSGLAENLFDGKIPLGGKLSSSGQIRSSGRNFYNLLLSLKTVNNFGVGGKQSNNNFTISNLEVKNYDVEKIIKNSYRSNSAQDISDIVAKAKKSGKSVFNQVKGDLSINRGIFKIYDSSFYNDISVSSLILSSSLFTNQLVGKFETYFQINKEKKLSFFTELAGYTDNITRKINVREIEDYISRRKSRY